MKFNQWTLALASAGIVSLGSIAQADEHMANSVLTQVSKTTLSGYVDTSAIWAIGEGGNANFPARTNDGTGRVDGFNLNVVELSLAKPLDESEWAAGYQVDLWLGPDAGWLGSDTFGGGSGGDDLGIKQAYVNLRAPVGTGLEIKMGHFDTIIGYEVGASHANPNFSRSYGFFIEPFQHTGILASYNLTEDLSISGGVANTYGFGINDRVDAEQGTGQGSESQKTYMASLSYELPESAGAMAGGALYLGFVDGLVAGYEDFDKTSYFVGATVPLSESLAIGFAFDYAQDTTVKQLGSAGVPLGVIRLSPKDRLNLPPKLTLGDITKEKELEELKPLLETLELSPETTLGELEDALNGTTLESLDAIGIGDFARSRTLGQLSPSVDAWALAGYLSYQIDPKTTFNARVDYARVKAAVLPNDAEFVSFTGTLDYDLWENVLTRLEFRWDHSLESDYDNLLGEAGKDDIATLALNAVYRF